VKITDPNQIVVTLDGQPIEGQETANAVRAFLLAIEVLASCKLTHNGKTVSASDVDPSALGHALAFLPADAANVIKTGSALAATRASRARRAERAA
jgi:hypothetical protein